MKKTILLLSAFLLTFSSLSGCSAKTANTSSDDTQVTTTEEAATEPTTQELVEIDPFEGADFVFAHNSDGDITEKSPYEFSKPEFINNSDDNQYQFLEDSTVKGLEKLNNKGCSISIIREPLNEECKEGDTVTYHLFIDDSIYTNDSLSNVKESYLAEYLAINYGVRLTRTTMKTKIHIEDDPPKEIENIDPFDGYTPTFSFNGYNYWIYNDSPKAELNNKLDSPKMRLEYSVSLAEGLGMNDLWFGDKVKYSIKLLYKGNEYTGEDVNKKLEELNKGIRLTQAEKIYDVKPSYISGTYSSNTNSSTARPDNWYQIVSNTDRFSKYDLRDIDGSTATIPITAELIRQFCDVQDDSMIGGYFRHNTTGTAYENLILKKHNKGIILVTEPSDDELAMAAENNVQLEVDPVALDGFVFITHKDNPVDSLTLDQIRDIYSGVITNWSEVGGLDEEIIPYTRDRNSGSQTAFENMVMQGTPVYIHPDTKTTMVEGMGGLIELVASYKNGTQSIGYTFNYYLNNLYKNDDIKVINIDGISPDNENLLDGSYPLTSAYYAVTLRGGSQKADEIKDFLLSDEGQEMIELAGYCPVR
ncbi:MAG TPA: substrate-binding domain-containing protein [Ruminococcus flavefaciens]|nr:substrate-binding domain-containing protein [Ruminococcus flavefaciens]